MASLPVGRRRVIVLLLLTAILVLTMDLRGNAVFDRGRSAFVWVLSPFENAAQVVTRPVVDAWRGISQYDELRAENRRLQEQIDGQRGAEIAARNAVLENQQLRALTELESLADIPTVTGSIIGDSPSNLDQVVEIDIGRRQGITVGMAVVNEAGLIGRITRVFQDSSLVMLITDTRYTVEAKILSEVDPTPVDAPPETFPSGVEVDDLELAITEPGSSPLLEGPILPELPEQDPDQADPEQVEPGTGEPGTGEPGTGEPGAEADGDPSSAPPTSTILPPVVVQLETGALRGQGGGRLPQVNFVTTTPTLGRISQGDTVFTTGGRNSLAPPNIPIGVVKNVITRPGSAGTRLEVAPAVNLGRLQFVRVVLYKPPVEIQVDG